MTGRPADNPFASRRVDGLAYRFDRGSTDEILARLRASDGRGAIIGPHGSGKTTLLEALAEQLSSTPVWVRLDAETRRPAAEGLAALPETVAERHVFVDGAEQLGTLGWWRLRHRVRHARAVVITSHRAGRLPTLHECRTTPALLRELVSELDPAAADATDLDALFDHHRGNIRLCLRHLYDLHSRQRQTS